MNKCKAVKTAFLPDEKKKAWPFLDIFLLLCEKGQQHADSKIALHSKIVMMYRTV